MTTPEPETGRIRWEDTKDSLDAIASFGHVGTRRSFIIYKPEFDRDRYRLLTLLGRQESFWNDDSGQLKAEAERWLSGFVASLGAVFGDAVAADLRSRASELEAMVDHRPGQERDNLLFAAGLKRAADLIEHGDQPAVPDEPAKETGQ